MEQPIVNLVTNFDADKDYTFNYTYLGSEQILTNEVQIREDIYNSEPVYIGIRTRFDKDHTLPAGTLENGKTYLIKLRVEVSEDVWSPFSPEMSFTTLKTPQYVYENLNDGKYVFNNDVLMRVLFQQEQGDRPEYYNFVLMDQNHIPLKRYPNKFPDPQQPNVMFERVSGLIKGKLYYIGCYTRTINGVNFFDSHEFIPHFVAPSTASVVEVNSDVSNGQVLVQSYLRQQLGIQTHPYIPEGKTNISMDYTFLDNEWLVVPPDMPLLYQKLGVGKSSDYVLKVWCKFIENGTFLKFETEHDNGVGIKFIKEDDAVIAKKEYLNEDGMGIHSIHRSNVISGLGKKEFYLYIKAIEFRVDIYIEEIKTV